MSENYYAVIMAGGGGTRLWPLSRQSQPKQMLRLIDDRSLFQIAVKRLDDIFPPDRILVVTVADQAVELHQQAPEIPFENFLIEPKPRGTASVIGLAGIVLRERNPHALMAVLTSDHFIGNVDKFRRLLEASLQVAQDGYLVTLGIEPTTPATGYGYIQRGEPIGSYQGLNVYHVLRFKEKPDETQAIEMLASGDHTWNSGMFVWQVSQIMEEFARQMPQLSTSLNKISQAWNTQDRQIVLDQEWSAIKSETIDYGIMEDARKVAVIPAEELRWSDVGSWDTIFDVLTPDQAGNIVLSGQYIGLGTSDSLVYNNQEDRLVVTIGIENLVVVDTGDVLLVCSKDEAQKVREVVNQLRAAGEKYI
jgi:mannose-1-phosphate guanylyltransferase